MALYGIPLISLFLIGAITFLIPVGLISSELAVGWPGGGGDLRVGRGGIRATLQRSSQSGANGCRYLVWYPTALSFGAATIAYIFKPECLAENNYFIVIDDIW